MEEESVIISCGTYSPDSYLSDELFNETGTPRRTTSTVQNEDQIQSRILEALQQTNLRFDQISEQFQKLGDRLESVETRLCGIEKRQAEFFSTPSSTPELKKSKVSPRVRVNSIFFYYNMFTCLFYSTKLEKCIRLYTTTTKISMDSLRSNNNLVLVSVHLK